MSSDFAGSALVVDDDPLVRELLRYQLASLGISDCLLAADGREALGFLHERQDIGLIFCDLKMPGMDGIEFLREAAKRIAHVRVILMSGMEPKVLRSAAALVKAHDLRLLGAVSKPLRLPQLKAVLERASHASEYVQPAQLFPISVEEVELALRNGEIKAYFQPQIDVKSGRVLGAEALARWEHPKGVLLPGRFLNLVERAGLMTQLTESMLKNAMQAVNLWRSHGLDITVAVNLTMDQVSQLSFPELICSWCEDAQVLPEQIELEITESNAMQDPVKTLDVATRLRMRGFSLGIDDFGTGFSSLSQLSDIPFNKLKIDQSFVAISNFDEEARRIVENTVSLARNLGMHSVAEGVESAEDWKLLRHLGCDSFQGYFVSQAKTAEDLLAWAQGEYAQMLKDGTVPPLD